MEEVIMEKIVVFGAGEFGRKYIKEHGDSIEVVAVVDNFLMGGGILGNRIQKPDVIKDLEFDYVMITINHLKDGGKEVVLEIYEQLKEMGIVENKILLMHNKEHNNLEVKFPRVDFVEKFARQTTDLEGAVAECGVCWGDFSQKINEVFPTRKLYLFDSFEGWNKDDLINPKEIWDKEEVEISNQNCMKYSSSLIAFLKHKFRKNVIIKKGFVPETFAGLENEKFCFVNLDMDVYAPTLAALNFFKDKMVEGGLILIHDQFEYPFRGRIIEYGAKIAVNEFLEENKNLKYCPIGDNCSRAILF
jgi:hypothetical protein